MMPSAETCEELDVQISAYYDQKAEDEELLTSLGIPLNADCNFAFIALMHKVRTLLCFLCISRLIISNFLTKRERDFLIPTDGWRFSFFSERYLNAEVLDYS
jgi:hypothetical protein